MKTWLTYLTAGLLGILSRSIFGDVSKACSVIVSLSSILPILSSLCMMTDVEISGFASAYTAHKKGVMCRICANDLV